MKRRALLIGMTSVLLAGCSGAGGAATGVPRTKRPTASPTETPRSTPTPTIEPLKPAVTDVNLVTEWVNFGDVAKNRINGAAPGAIISIGYGYTIDIQDGVHDVTIQSRIFDSEGQRITQSSSEDRQLVNSSGYQEWEGSSTFDTTGWEQGTYEAEVIIRDEESGKTSEATTGTFNLNAPLGKGEALLRWYNGPDSLNPGETFDFSLTFENRSDRDSSIVSGYSVKKDGSDWYPAEVTVSLTIPAGETREKEITGAEAFSEPGRYTFRLDEIGETWEYEVS